MDGAKAYLTSCLLWDPLEDADKLLDEFYYNFFGRTWNQSAAFTN